MANATKPEVTKEELEAAQSMWHSFTTWGKYSIIGVCALLALMAVTLL